MKPWGFQVSSPNIEKEKCDSKNLSICQDKIMNVKLCLVIICSQEMNVNRGMKLNIKYTKIVKDLVFRLTKMHLCHMYHHDFNGNSTKDSTVLQ